MILKLNDKNEILDCITYSNIGITKFLRLKVWCFTKYQNGFNNSSVRPSVSKMCWRPTTFASIINLSSASLS